MCWRRRAVVALNFEREPMHEADQYERFSQLQDAGATSGEIAGRFGIEESRVNRMLALGKLSPLILEAWRDGTLAEIGEEGGIVRAFTLAPTTKDQEAVLRLKKSGNLRPHLIRRVGAGSGEALRI